MTSPDSVITFRPGLGCYNIAWVGTSSGFFSINCTYRMVKESSWNPREEVWKLPWKEIIKVAYSWAKQFISARKGRGSIRQVSREGMVETEEWIRRFLRDHNGNWILGFNRRLESCSVFEVELWDILDGVALVLGRQHDRILVQTDNMEVIRAIKKAWSKRSNSTIIRRITQLL
ncbi:hypothetical protein Goklo_000118 [Gossypium klotzschianum]|uniref:RNase H type-1 domain-containing protein n=1 Tax=Gossypium klotzschianum TaxID=34286 RepID=A0A7J8W2W7_9ROSI|nr:hypothetical protein [Gossypium klotzschianum]